MNQPTKTIHEYAANYSHSMVLTNSRNENRNVFSLPQNFKKTMTDLAFDHNLQIGDVKKFRWGAYVHLFAYMAASVAVLHDSSVFRQSLLVQEELVVRYNEQEKGQRPICHSFTQ